MPIASTAESDGYVLHSYPYKETSLILETFTRAHGRVAMVAKGAKRGSAKYALNPFQPLVLTWFGRAEMKTLKASEHQRIHPQLRGAALMAGFYVNELVLRLAAKDDPHETLFSSYAETLAALAESSAANETGSRALEIILRRFELGLLNELGYGLTLTHEADSDMPIDPRADYLYVVERGPVRVTGREEIRALEPVALKGRTLIALADGVLSDVAALLQAKQLMRRVLNHHLGDRALHTRQLIRELK